MSSFAPLQHFQEKVVFRLFSQERRAVKFLVKNNPDKYESESQFYRAAVMKLLKEESKRQVDEVFA